MCLEMQAGHVFRTVLTAQFAKNLTRGQVMSAYLIRHASETPKINKGATDK